MFLNRVFRCLFVLILFGCWLAPPSGAQVPPYDQLDCAVSTVPLVVVSLDIGGIFTRSRPEARAEEVVVEHGKTRTLRGAGCGTQPSFTSAGEKQIPHRKKRGSG